MFHRATHIGAEQTAILPAPKSLSTNSAKRADAIYFIKAASAAGGVPSKHSRSMSNRRCEAE
nr:hypothetical protein [uncultured Campylobacter sp.]